MRVAIIGVGRMGRRHISAVKKLGMKLVGVYDVRAESLALAQQEGDLQVEQLFDDLEKLYSTTQPQCLIVSTTADSHCTLVCNAAKRSVKFILVEKPIATSLKECELMIRTCREYGVLLSVNHQMRFMEQYSRPRALLNSDIYGGLKSMTVIGGNFGISMNGTHYIEAFRYITDEKPIEVTAWFSGGSLPNPRGPQFEDRAGSVRVTTSSGRRLYIDVGLDQGHGIRVIYASRNGLITVDELSGEMIATVRQRQYQDLPTSRYGMPADNTHELITPAEVIDSTALTIDALINDKNCVTAEEGMLAVRVLVAAYRSAENGSSPVLLSDHLDRDRIFPWA
jgi:predicted dehydrogenase